MIRFHNRTEAGKLLAEALKPYKGQAGVVYPLPRGGVPLGVEIAKALEMEMDLLIPRKVGHPYNPEYAIAAVGETGEPVINPVEVSRVDPEWFKRAVQKERDEASRRRKAYLGDRQPISVEGKVAIVVDDGIATGLTMRAAINDARARRPAKLVVAIPVVPADTATRLREIVDDLVAIEISEHYLGAVGSYYDEFPQLEDEDVISLFR